MKNLYFVTVLEKDGKVFPNIAKINSSMNIASALKHFTIAHYCSTKKEAEKTLLAWVKDYHNNNRLDKSYYLFEGDAVPFLLKGYI